MAYEKLNLIDGDTLDASHIEHIENGILNAEKMEGPQGPIGETGTGILSVEQTTISATDEGDNIVTITLTDGRKVTFKVRNGSRGSIGPTGAQGERGVQGERGATGNGVASIVQTTTSNDSAGTNIITVTMTDGTTARFSVKNGAQGATGEAGKTPVNGTDYNTESDKLDMVERVLAALPKWTGGSY